MGKSWPAKSKAMAILFTSWDENKAGKRNNGPPKCLWPTRSESLFIIALIQQNRAISQSLLVHPQHIIVHTVTTATSLPWETTIAWSQNSILETLGLVTEVRSWYQSKGNLRKSALKEAVQKLWRRFLILFVMLWSSSFGIFDSWKSFVDNYQQPASLQLPIHSALESRKPIEIYPS